MPFGLSGGQLETGTDHARADGVQGSRFELTCKPWCLFNLTSDIGERTDLGGNPAYQVLAQKMVARLAYHGSTGPMPAYIWTNRTVLATKLNEMCLASVQSGYVEPLDIGVESRGTATAVN